ncbi:hypothetical protein EI42_05347 [Thermosporothrix hazakensis]|jgi:hypothetical protein|uniref:Uncharacterized protein n=1 Tax=Thermosporothrix hazakensis TaxID=644383 RepID=A0A326U8C0_THEHA|nr:PTS sucrose transporter subunit IIBC [Thermosporothrix hazakensis]PZW22562.1 hypothetical protein EI42_05347 [Thermosporothrix hazakensis]GCE48534.1 hypothetical protein KTH_34030 [Thermosporothrix hazakensis]
MDGFLIADIFGFLISLPIALFLAFWLSAVRKKAAVVGGAFVAGLIGFLIILLLTDTHIFANPLINTDPLAVFFSSVFFCSILGLVGGILTDLLLGGKRNNNYSAAH